MQPFYYLWFYIFESHSEWWYRILRKRNSLHTLLNWTQTIMIFMKCSWVPYNLCLSTAILKGVNIFCILWLATKHHQSKLDLYQPQSLKRVSLSLSLLLLLSNDHPLQKPLIVDRKRSRAWHKHLKEPRTTHFSKNLQSVSLCTYIIYILLMHLQHRKEC